jgi:hypothetical protein
LLSVDEVSRNERILVATSCDMVVLPWESRQALLEQLRRLGLARSAITAFEAVGTARPVMLDVRMKLLVRDVIWRWSGEVGADGLPYGVWRLRTALVDDLDNTACSAGLALEPSIPGRNPVDDVIPAPPSTARAAPAAPGPVSTTSARTT